MTLQYNFVLPQKLLSYYTTIKRWEKFCKLLIYYLAYDQAVISEESI